MELQFLGTGAGVPSKQRNVTSIALKLLDECNEIWLFDCGEGTQQQILRTTIRPRKVCKIFITHLHGDHIFGLPGFLSSRSFQGGQTPLTLYGPKGIKEYVETSLRISESRLSYPIEYVEITQEGELLETDRFQVSCRFLDHRIQSLGYRVVEKDHVGELQVEKLKAMDVPPGPLYKKIKNKQMVTLPDGRTIDGKDFVGQDQKGRIVTILGDTRKHPNSVLLAQDADVLVHESTFEQAEAVLAKNYYHSTAVQAAEVAKEAGAKKLLMTHISARYIGKAVKPLEEEARNILPASQVVQDFEIVDIPFQKEESRD